MDLGAPDAPDRLYEEVKQRGHRVDLLINNAGFGLFGEYMAIPEGREREMVVLDVLVPLALTRRFGQDMLTRKEGWILQISSIGGYQPNPLYASYGAAKAFILNWGEAVNYEWKDSGVKLSVLSPGITATEFLKVSGQKATLYQRLVMMSSPAVTLIGLKALAKGKASVVPGFLNKLTLLSNRLMPRSWIPPLAHRLMRNH
jgi:short-subunit dehydrogenase